MSAPSVSAPVRYALDNRLLCAVVAPLDSGPTPNQLIFDLAKYALVAVPGNGCPKMMDQMVVLTEEQCVENAPWVDSCVEIALPGFVRVVRQEIET